MLTYGQIPTRIIVNSGFESPVIGCSPASYNFMSHNNIPGWKTLDSVPAPLVNCGTSGSSVPYLIEFWSSGFNGRASHSGNQLAEINASAATFLYQEICVLANEAVPFSVWHLRRASSGTTEKMVAELKTISNTNIVTGSVSTAGASWINYTGSLTNNGTSGLRKYGFRATSGGSLGNLVDDVTITLKPLADIKSFVYSSVYEPDTNYLQVYVNGTLNGSATLTLTKSGTATYASDYTIGTPTRGSVSMNGSGTITLTLPAGDYNPNLSSGSTLGLIRIPFYVVNDFITEPNETVIYTVSAAANGGNGNAALNLSTGIGGQSAACASTMSSSQFTIIDAIALPVRLISFTAEREMGYNSIQWEVAEEDNTDKYLLEYSTNGAVFGIVDEIYYNPANGMNYMSTHRPVENENAYYRLSVVDKNGNTTILSKIITVTKNINTTFKVYPNPNNGIFTVNFFSTREMATEFTISDMLGKKVYNITLFAQKGENTIPVAIEQTLENGIYNMTYTYGSNTKTVRLTVLR